MMLTVTELLRTSRSYPSYSVGIARHNGNHVWSWQLQQSTRTIKRTWTIQSLPPGARVVDPRRQVHHSRLIPLSGLETPGLPSTYWFLLHINGMCNVDHYPSLMNHYFFASIIIVNH